jgi:uncharacterized membrane protein YbhN (UPF0104 family)
LETLVKKLYLSIGLGAVVFLAISIYVDAGLLLKTIGRFDWLAGLLALGLAALNYLARFWRWHLYMKRLEIPIPPLENFRIFLSGLALSVTPGKAGELVKAYLLRKSVGSPVGKGASAVFTERLTDFVALLLLSLVGIYSVEEGMLTLMIAASGIASIFLVIFLPGAIPLILRILGRIPFAARFVGPAQDAYVSARRLLSPVLLLQGLLIGILAWFAECAGFFFVLKGFGAVVSLSDATFIYAFATIFGALTLLPGGIGTTEGSMTGLLTMQGLPIVDAAAATFVIRACTLWFAVAVGAIVLVKYAATHDVADLDPAVNDPAP